MSVSFGGVKALKDVSLTIPTAAVTGLIGPNGAGKTTLFNVITGVMRPLAGRVLFAGSDISAASRGGRARLGLARTFQSIQLFESLSVMENVMAGAARFTRAGLAESVIRAPRATADDRFATAVALRAVRLLDLTDVADQRCADLPYGLRRRAEIARALAAGPRLLLLDEPSAGMDPIETAALADVISHLVNVLGIGVLLVEHDMAMVHRCVDHMYVLDAGEIIAAGEPRGVLSHPRVVRAYLGGKGDGDA